MFQLLETSFKCRVSLELIGNVVGDRLPKAKRSLKLACLFRDISEPRMLGALPHLNPAGASGRQRMLYVVHLR